LASARQGARSALQNLPRLGAPGGVVMGLGVRRRPGDSPPTVEGAQSCEIRSLACLLGTGPANKAARRALPTGRAHENEIALRCKKGLPAKCDRTGTGIGDLSNFFAWAAGWPRHGLVLGRQRPWVRRAPPRPGLRAAHQNQWRGLDPNLIGWKLSFQQRQAEASSHFAGRRLRPTARWRRRPEDQKNPKQGKRGRKERLDGSPPLRIHHRSFSVAVAGVLSMSGLPFATARPRLRPALHPTVV